MIINYAEQFCLNILLNTYYNIYFLHKIGTWA